MTNPFRCWFDTPQLTRALHRAGFQATQPTPQRPPTAPTTVVPARAAAANAPAAQSSTDKPRFGVDTSTPAARKTAPPAPIAPPTPTPAPVPQPSAPNEARTQPRGAWPSNPSIFPGLPAEPTRPPTGPVPVAVMHRPTTPAQGAMPRTEGLDLTQRLSHLLTWLEQQHQVSQAFVATEEGLPLANDGTDEAYVALVAVIDHAIAETALGARPFWGDLTLQIAPDRTLTVLHVIVGGERFALGAIGARPLDEPQRETMRMALARVFESNLTF